jgi:hypothetical protein
VVYFLKKNYIIGLVLLLCFILFISAGAAGEGSEVAVGSVGFFGVVALLPLFLYLLFSEIKARKEEVMVRTQIKEEIASQEIREQPQGPPLVTGLGLAPPPQKDEIDRDFIESIRSEHLDIPDWVNHVQEEESHDLIGGLEEKEPTHPEGETEDSQEKEIERKKEDSDSEEEQEKKEEDV